MKYAIRQIKYYDGSPMNKIYRNVWDEKDALNDIFKRLVEVFDVWMHSKAEFDIVEVQS